MDPEQYPDLISRITTDCYNSHAKLIQTANSENLKAFKRVIKFWILLPVGLLSGLLVTAMKMTYTSGVKSAEHRVATEMSIQKQNESIDKQTLTIGVEIKQREISDTELRKQIEALDVKLDNNIRWLIQNGDFKYRGANPLLAKPSHDSNKLE